MTRNEKTIVVVAITGYVGGLAARAVGLDRPLGAAAAVAVAIAGAGRPSGWLRMAAEWVTLPGQAVVRLLESEAGKPGPTQGQTIIMEARP
jgi:hypothetical protein